MSVLALEVLNQIADAAGWPQLESIESPDLTPEERKLVRALNRVLRSMVGINDWPMLRAEGSIITVPSEKSDSDSSEYVTATNGSDTLTVAGYSFDRTYKQRAIQVSGDDTVYRIKDVLSATQVQLNRIYVGDSITVTDEKVATIGADRYGLPDDFCRPVDKWNNFFSPYALSPKSVEDFRQRRRRDRGITEGDPDIYTVFGMNPGETVQLVHFHPYPENQRLLEFDYIRHHPEVNSDNDKILFPLRFIEPIINVCVELIDRQYDDAQTETALAAALKSYNEQQTNPGVTAGHLELRPDLSVRTSVRRGFGIRGAHVDYGDYFDNVSNVGLG
jgi:hypothetical protein